MNKKIKSFDEFGSRFKNQELPEVDYKELQVMGYKRVPIFLRASFITLFLTLFITASVVAAVQLGGWTFLNSEGEQVFEMATMTKDEAAPHLAYDRLYAKYRNKIEVIQNTMPEGEFKYFLSVEAYEKIGLTSLTILMKGTQIESVTQIPSDFIKPIHLKDEMQNEYVLTDGTILYYPLQYGDTEYTPYHEVEDVAAIAEELYLEAKENQVEFIEKPGVVSSEISEVSLNYRGKSEENDQGVQIIIRTANEGISTTEDLAGYVKVTEEGIDFLVNEEGQNLYFVKGDGSKKLLVHVRLTFHSVEGPVKKEEVLAIAKSLLN